MRRILFALTLLASCMAASSALAQRPATRSAAPVPAPSAALNGAPSGVNMNTLEATPEMWFYEQERQRYHDPKEMVRQNAAFEAAQRKQRIAAMKWYGYSNSRPSVNPTPFGASYAPTWNNATIRPWSWAATTRQVYIMHNGGR